MRKRKSSFPESIEKRNVIPARDDILYRSHAAFRATESREGMTFLFARILNVTPFSRVTAQDVTVDKKTSG